MSRLKEMKTTKQKQDSSPVYTILTIVVILFFGAIIYFGFVAPKSGLDIKALEGTGTYSKGQPEAKVSIVEFSDFECPSCARVYPFFKQLIEEYPDSVKVTYRHFPLPQHKNSQKAAQASECSGEQGKFWEMHDWLFENQQNLSVESIKSIAQGLGLDASKFNECLDSGKYTSKVSADMSYGVSIGVNSTPTVYVNGREVKVAAYSDLKSAVTSQLG